MGTDLFGNKIIKEETFELVYQGSSFSEGKILVSSLCGELSSLEELLKDSIGLFIKTGKIGSGFSDFQIFVQIEKGSIKEKIKVVFRNKATIAVIGTFIIPFLNTTYDHFLNKPKDGKVLGEFVQEVQTVAGDQRFKNNLKNILSPLSSNDDSLLINNGELNINISYDQKESINKNIDNSEVEEKEFKKNGEFQEELRGVIRKLDLDAPGNNYFGFNINKGQNKVPTSIKGEFNLFDYKDIIDVEIKIKANVKYKDDIIKNIEILEYEVLEKNGKQERISF